MGQILHGSATTTEAVRRAIQHSQESLRALAKRYGVNPKTIAKWKARKSVADLRTGPKELRSTVLTAEEEAVVVAFRRHTLLPLDDCLYALQPTIPHLTRSSLHRCLKRHGISRLPQVEGEASPKRKFKPYPIGYFHIDIAEVRTAQGKLYLIVAIDRTSKFAFVELHEKVTRKTAADFLRRLIAAVPYKVHTVLTDNGTHFTDPAGETWSPAEIKEMIASRRLFHAHAFEYACALNDIDHRLTKPKHPWTNGQVERMNRTLKDATVKRYFYETHDQLRAHLRDFVDAYNFARRLKTLRGLTPYEFICKAWTSQPEGSPRHDTALMLQIVIFPQALRFASPPFVSLCVNLVKATSLVSIVGLWELTMASREIVERHAGAVPDLSRRGGYLLLHLLHTGTLWQIP